MQNNNEPVQTQQPDDSTLPPLDLPLSDAQSQEMPAGHLNYAGDTGVRAMYGDLGSWATQSSLATTVVQGEIWGTKAFDPAEAEKIQQDHKDNNDYWRERGDNISGASVWSKSLLHEPLHLVGGVADMATSPENWIAAFLTGGASEFEEGAGWVAKGLQRAARGAVVTGLGTGLTAPIVNSSTPWSGQHLGLKAAAQNILYGSGGEVALGGLGDAWKSPMMQKVRANFKLKTGSNPENVPGDTDIPPPSTTLDPSAADKAFAHQAMIDNEMPPAQAQMASHVAGMAQDLTAHATQNLTDTELADPATKQNAVQKAMSDNLAKMIHYKEIQGSIVDTAQDEQDYNYPAAKLSDDVRGLTQGELFAAKQRIERAQNLAPEMKETLDPIAQEIKNNTYNLGASAHVAKYEQSLDDLSLDRSERADLREKYLRSYSSDFEREQLESKIDRANEGSRTDTQKEALRTRLQALQDRTAANSPITDEANEYYKQYKSKDVPDEKLVNKINDFSDRVNDPTRAPDKLEHPFFNHLRNMEELAENHSHLETEQQNLSSVNSMLSSGTSNVNPFTESEKYFNDRGNDDNSLYSRPDVPTTKEAFDQSAPYKEPMFEDDVRKNITDMDDDVSAKDEHVPRRTSEETSDETPLEAEGPAEESNAYTAKIKADFGSFAAMTHSIFKCILGGN